MTLIVCEYTGKYTSLERILFNTTLIMLQLVRDTVTLQ